MQKRLPILVILLGFTLVVTGVSALLQPVDGVIAVDGWAHGVALCQGDVPDEDMVTQVGEYHMWQSDGVMYTVNYGHLGDDEKEQLVSLATINCNQL